MPRPLRDGLLRVGLPPLVIAHRGASAHAPENTMPAFLAAWDAGVDWVEADTQPTVDGVPVVLHDADLDRTTTGRGPVRDVRALDLATVDAGRWFDTGFAGSRVPELSEVLDVLTGRRALLLEIKGEHTDHQVLAILEAVRAAGADDRVFLQSFELPVLGRLRNLAGGSPFGLLVESLHDDPVAAVSEIGAAAYNPRVGDVLRRPAAIADLHSAGIAVLVWTSDDPAEWLALTELGVDGIITNTPAALLAWHHMRPGGN